MAIALLLVDKTPQTVCVLLVIMAALAIFPVFQFARVIWARAIVLVLTFALIGVFGWIVWPNTHQATPSEPKVAIEHSSEGLTPRHATSAPVPDTPPDEAKEPPQPRPKPPKVKRQSKRFGHPILSAPTQELLLPISPSLAMGQSVGSVIVQSGGVASVNQQGGQTAQTIVNNNGPSPPKVTVSTVASNTPASNMRATNALSRQAVQRRMSLYESVFNITIAEGTIAAFEVEVTGAPSIVQAGIGKDGAYDQSTATIYQSGRALLQTENAHGTYVLTILSTLPEHPALNPRCNDGKCN
jgi:hypothetical protein